MLRPLPEPEQEKNSIVLSVYFVALATPIM